MFLDNELYSNTFRQWIRRIDCIYKMSWFFLDYQFKIDILEKFLMIFSNKYLKQVEVHKIFETWNMPIESQLTNRMVQTLVRFVQISPQMLCWGVHTLKTHI